MNFIAIQLLSNVSLGDKQIFDTVYDENCN